MIRIATFDIETSNLNADFGIILCAVVKDAHKKKPIILRADRLNPDWETKRSNDKELVHQLAELLASFDILIAHNGVRFDIPFIRTRLARWGLPPLPDLKIVDPVQLARNKLRMSRNGLAAIADFLGVNSKTSVTGTMWLQAALDGDRKAMDYITAHCVEDIKTLDAVVDAVKGYSTAINSWGSGR